MEVGHIAFLESVDPETFFENFDLITKVEFEQDYEALTTKESNTGLYLKKNHFSRFTSSYLTSFRQIATSKENMNLKNNFIKIYGPDFCNVAEKRKKSVCNNRRSLYSSLIEFTKLQPSNSQKNKSRPLTRLNSQKTLFGERFERIKKDLLNRSKLPTKSQKYSTDHIKGDIDNGQKKQINIVSLSDLNRLKKGILFNSSQGPTLKISIKARENNSIVPNTSTSRPSSVVRKRSSKIGCSSKLSKKRKDKDKIHSSLKNMASRMSRNLKIACSTANLNSSISINNSVEQMGLNRGHLRLKIHSRNLR